MFIIERILLTIAVLRDRREDSEVGASMVEYALLVAGMALVVVLATTAFGTKITAIIDGIKVPGAAT